MEAAVASIAGASVGAAAASSSDVRNRPVIVATAAALGGLSGLLVFKVLGRESSSSASSSTSPSVEKAIRLLDAVHKLQPRRPEDALGEHGYCQEVERWVVELSGNLELVSPALRIAARAQHLERHIIKRDSYPEGRQGYLQWRAAVKQRQGKRLKEILQNAGLDSHVVEKASRLVAKELPLGRDREMQILEDAACLVFLQHELSHFQNGKDAVKMVDIIQKTWLKMSIPARVNAIGLDYEPKLLGHIVEAILEAEKSADKPETPMVAPRLEKACIMILRKSWQQVPKETFGADFYERLFTEDAEIRKVFDFPVARPDNIWKVVQLLLDLLEAETVPQLERIVHAMAVLSRKYGLLRLQHFAAIKRALVRTVTSYGKSKQEKRAYNRAWEAFFYAIAAVMGPVFALEDKLSEFAAATAAALPTPGGGPHAAAIAAHGAALLEMSINITSLSQGGATAPDQVVAKLQEARSWLIDCVRDDVNAYCGLLSSVYSRVSPEELAALIPQGKISSDSLAENTERNRWLLRAAQVPMRVAELAIGIAIACLPLRKTIKASLKEDWIAGGKLLCTASEISLKNVSLNLRDMGVTTKGAQDVEKRFAKVRDTEPPWEDLINLS